MARVNLTRIYTRLGDGGETHLGDMSRVPKTHPRIVAYGTVDELNAHLGVALAGQGLTDEVRAWLIRIQNDLFDVGADLSVPDDDERERLRVTEAQTLWLEERCDEVNAPGRGGGAPPPGARGRGPGAGGAWAGAPPPPRPRGVLFFPRGGPPPLRNCTCAGPSAVAPSAAPWRSRTRPRRRSAT